MKRLVPLVLLAAVTATPSAARANSVCIAVDNVPLIHPGTKTAVGVLEKRTCVGLLERLDDAMRVWVSNDVYQGESLLAYDAVLNLLVDDVDIKLTEDGASHGRILSGTPVLVLSNDGDTARVKTVEGNVDIEFVVESDAIYPTESWPSPDPDEEPPDGWPVPDRVVPPQGGPVTVDAAGNDAIATVRSRIYDVDDLLLDPAVGRMGYLVVGDEDEDEKKKKKKKDDEEEEVPLDVRVKLVTPTLWVEGFAPSLDWRAEPPATGWDPTQGARGAAPWQPGPRQVGKDAVGLSPAPKGDAVGKLLPGSRVTVNAEERGWLDVTMAWPGGSVRGWVQKKYLLKPGKESAAVPVAQPIAAIAVKRMARQWEDATGHEEENEDGVVETTEPDVDLDSVRKQLTDRFGELQLEYARILARTPDADGTLTGRVVVDPEGTIVQAHLPEGTLRVDALQQRLVTILEELTFEEREVPKKKKKRKKKDEPEEPETNWNVQVWIQFGFKNS